MRLLGTPSAALRMMPARMRMRAGISVKAATASRMVCSGDDKGRGVARFHTGGSLVRLARIGERHLAIGSWVAPFGGARIFEFTRKRSCRGEDLGLFWETLAWTIGSMERVRFPIDRFRSFRPNPRQHLFERRHLGFVVIGDAPA